MPKSQHLIWLKINQNLTFKCEYTAQKHGNLKWNISKENEIFKSMEIFCHNHNPITEIHECNGKCYKILQKSVPKTGIDIYICIYIYIKRSNSGSNICDDNLKFFQKSYPIQCQNIIVKTSSPCKPTGFQLEEYQWIKDRHLAACPVASGVMWEFRAVTMTWCNQIPMEWSQHYAAVNGHIV